MISPALHQLFDAPPRDFGPTPLWWWSGAKVTREQLDWQLRRFAAGGVHNLVVINLAPAGPAFGARTDDPPWFGEEWWDRFTDTCRIARDIGTRLWFYDQIGFSGANVQGAVTRHHPETAGLALRSRRATVTGGTIALRGAETLVAAYDMEGHLLPTVPEGEDVQLVVAVPTAFDYLDPHAVSLLLDTVHHEYDRRVPEYLGNVIAGSFQDELPGTNSWSHRFPGEFRARRGYDLLDHLPALFGPLTARAAKIRADYHAVRTELTEEALFKPLAAWHDERGMLVGADQSHPARAGFPAQSTQIYTDYFRTHRWYGAAGSDHHGDSKVHSSMAHLYGHERVWIEAFHSSGWGGTLADTYDWLLPFLRSGANLYNPHASYFGTAGGWFEWAPPSTDWRQPYWRQYPAFSRAVARICSIMSWGTYSADVAVLHPTATMQSLIPLDAPVQHFGDGRLGDDHADVDETQRDYLDLCGTNNWLGPHVGSLDRHRIAFDVIDDASVQRATAAEGALRVADLSYRAVLLPSASVLEEETARRLTQLLDAGGRVVVVGRPPATAAGMTGDDSVVAALLKHPRLERASDAEAGAAAVADTAGHATGEVPLLVRRRGVEAVALVTGTFPDARTLPGDAHHEADPARYARHSTVTVQAEVTEAEIWNPATGTRQPAQVAVADGRSTIEVPLEGAPAVLVVWREGTPRTRQPATPTPVPERTIDLSTGWEGRLVPTMDNTWGDLALPAGSSVTAPQIWTMRWTETEDPDANWQQTKATYGNQVRVLAPVPSAGAPDPLDVPAVEQVLAGDLPLTPDDWSVSRYSTSRGIPDPDGLLGNKGLVTEEFVRVPVPGPGSIARVRAIVDTDHRGPAELHIGAAATKRVWWNGRRLDIGTGYCTTARVEIGRTRNVLEYELGDAQDRPMLISGAADTPLGSYFCLSRPDAFGPRPQFMCLPEDVRPAGGVTYRGRLNAVGRAALVVGAAVGVTVLLDGAVVARQEKVEYYESDWGAVPMFFRHELALGEGEHVLEVVADAVDPREAVFIDCVADAANYLVSGAGWEAEAGEWRGRTVEHDGRWGELQHCYAAVRPHPLPDTEWLTGAPVLGGAVLPVRATDSVRERAQRFRFTVPPGTVSLDLPLELAARVRVGDGEEVGLDGSVLTMDQPLSEPTEVEVVTVPTAVLRGGSGWRGPVRVRTVAAQLPLGDWKLLGLGGWSGGVTYSREVEVPAGADAVLDLGRVRGSVSVEVDGVEAGEAFCPPYRFELPRTAAGLVRVEVTVNNTLAPYLAEATPTAWAFPAQLSSGLLGPVTLRVRDRQGTGGVA
ncbi:glycosyl hydrolase [Streptomyces sp. NBC_00252]|uniref:glycosyl hydrolase n=1 Tax=Streptomyces sp. NBC_00252 TaxID=2975691 RepID=UPI002E298B9D|nr:glycosyl hydrolase [Streptomyces sp. NBC_00252]